MFSSSFQITIDLTTSTNVIVCGYVPYMSQSTQFGILSIFALLTLPLAYVDPKKLVLITKVPNL